MQACNKKRRRPYTLRRRNKRNNVSNIYQLDIPNEIHDMIFHHLDDKHRARLSVTCKHFHLIYGSIGISRVGKKEHACKYCGIWYPSLEEHMAIKKKYIIWHEPEKFIVKRKHLCFRCYAKRHCWRCGYINESIPLDDFKTKSHQQYHLDRDLQDSIIMRQIKRLGKDDTFYARRMGS